jgi:hypothetical protein
LESKAIPSEIKSNFPKDDLLRTQGISTIGLKLDQSHEKNAPHENSISSLLNNGESTTLTINLPNDEIVKIKLEVSNKKKRPKNGKIFHMIDWKTSCL